MTLVIHISNLISLWSKTYALYCHFISTFYFKKFGIHRMQVFAIAFLHAIFWPNIILTEKISRASKSLLYTINHHKLLNLNLKFLLLLMQCQYAKSRWVKNGKIVQYNFKNKYLNGKKIFQRNSSQNCTFLDYIAHCEYYCCYGGR